MQPIYTLKSMCLGSVISCDCNICVFLLARQNTRAEKIWHQFRGSDGHSVPDAKSCHGRLDSQPFVEDPWEDVVCSTVLPFL